MKPDGRGRISLGKGNMDTASTPTIRVEIYNQTYNIRSDGDSEYITQLAEFVDTRMREISSGTLTVDSLKVAILAALHIADELHRLKRLHEQTDSQLASRSAECAEMLDRLLKVRSNVEQQQNSPAGNIAFT
jgi:cell division protein ZapA